VETYEVDGKSVIQTGQYENNYRTGDWLVYYLGSKDKLKRAEILKVNFDEQPPSIKNAIRSVPAIIVLKDGRPVATWQADLSMQLKVSVEAVQDVIDGKVVPTLRRRSTN